MNEMLARLIDKAKVVVGLAPITPSSSTPDYVALDAFTKLTVLIAVDNGTTVTGSAITLKQAKDASGTDEKALSFSKVWACEDVAANSDQTETDVTSDTFTTDDTNAKNLLYQIEVDATDLDMANGFDYVRVGTGNGANMVLCALYILHGAKVDPTNVDPTD
jgi:hypothetical protein